MADFPPAPVESIEWNKLGFGHVREVNGHVECDYDAATGTWSAPRFVKDPYLRVHGLAPGLNYGQQAFEGMKAYRDPQGQILVFRPSDHAQRFQVSCAAIAIPVVPEDLFLKSVYLALARNAEFVPPHDSEAAMYVRPLAFGSEGFFAVSAGPGYKFCVFTQPFTAYHGVSPVKALVLDEFDRAAPLGTGHVKVGGNYAPVLKWSDQAHAEGFTLTLHLDSRTHSEIDEFSTSGFVGVKPAGNEKYTLVVPDSRSVLRSVTSMSVLDQARSFGWGVEVRPIPFAELRYFSEVLAVGTAAMVVPVRSITRRSTGNVFEYGSEPGPCCARLSKSLKAIQKGIEPDPYGWVQRVPRPDE
ncbi:hypothetical protein VTN96DRAFT_4986 [Rasamsonia emersonii]